MLPSCDRSSDFCEKFAKVYGQMQDVYPRQEKSARRRANHIWCIRGARSTLELNDQSLPLDPIRKTSCATHSAWRHTHRSLLSCRLQEWVMREGACKASQTTGRLASQPASQSVTSQSDVAWQRGVRVLKRRQRPNIDQLTNGSSASRVSISYAGNIRLAEGAGPQARTNTLFLADKQ